jgi:hypothetical protein
MADARVLPGLVLVAAMAAVVLMVLAVLGIAWPGRRRAGLVAAGVPLALVPPVAATAYVSWRLVRLFASMAEAQGGTSQALVAACSTLWLVERAAWAAFAAACALGLLLGLVRGGASDGVPCSGRRGIVLVLLPLLGLLVAASVAWPVASAMRVTAAVVSSDGSDPESKRRTDAVLAAEGLATTGSGSIGDISRFVARGAMVGTFGGALAAVVLLGLAVPGAILAGRVSFGGSFLAVASLLWLLGATIGGLLATGLVNPLRLS